MGGFSLSQSKLRYPDVTVAMLNDIAKYSLLFDDHDNAWQLSVNAYKIGVAYAKEAGALMSFLQLYKVSSSSHDRLNPALEKIAEHALKVFVKKGWNTAQITPILNEIQGNLPPLEEMTTEKPVPLEKLPESLQGWMDVLAVYEIDGADILVVRNDTIQGRVGILLEKHPDLKNLKTGHKIALTKGDFSISNATPDIVKKHSILLTIVPDEGSEISYEGEYGFSYLKVAAPKAEV